MAYEDLEYARKCIEDLKKYTGPEAANYEFVQAMLAVLDFADSEYSNRAEEIGTVAIENIEELKGEWLNKVCEYARKTYGPWFSETRELNFRKFMTGE